MHGHVDVTAEVLIEGATELLLDAKHLAIDVVRDISNNEKVTLASLAFSLSLHIDSILHRA